MTTEIYPMREDSEASQAPPQTGDKQATLVGPLCCTTCTGSTVRVCLRCSGIGSGGCYVR